MCGDKSCVNVASGSENALLSCAHRPVKMGGSDVSDQAGAPDLLTPSDHASGGGSPGSCAGDPVTEAAGSGLRVGQGTTTVGYSSLFNQNKSQGRLRG